MGRGPARIVLLGVMSGVGALATSRAQDTGLSRDERVVIYPTAGWLDPEGGHWRVPLHVCVFEPEHDDPLRAALVPALREALDLARSETERRLFAQRARLFLVDHERRKRVSVLADGASFRVGPTEPNGHAEIVIDVPAPPPVALATLPLAIGADGDPTGARGTAWLVPPRGLSVISDLDDTVKITQVRDKREALANTLLREFRPVPGMADLYARIARPREDDGGAASAVAFHYVSLSPWQLAPLLQEFLAREGFPGGSLHLQHFRIQDGDFGDLVGDSRAKKLAAIEPFFATWPARRFVLIGDSGQSDPEVYGELARRHREQVELVLIRSVDGASEGDAPSSPRFAAAFDGIPAGKWQVFVDPAEVRLGE